MRVNLLDGLRASCCVLVSGGSGDPGDRAPRRPGHSPSLARKSQDLAAAGGGPAVLLALPSPGRGDSPREQRLEQESETDSEIEGRQPTDRHDQLDKNDTTAAPTSRDTDNSSIPAGRTQPRCAAMDVPSGVVSLGDRHRHRLRRERHTMTTTENESKLVQRDCRGETTTDSELERRQRRIRSRTPTMTRRPTRRRRRADGAAGIILSGSMSDSVDDTGSAGESA